MLRVAICDDNNAVCSEIEELILSFAKINFIDIVIEVFFNGYDMIRFIETTHQFDLIFLDIELGGITGIEVGDIIRNKLHDHISKIVFISSADGYEYSLFDLQPLNFLRKPITSDKIYKCINLAIEIFNINNNYFEYSVRKENRKVSYKEIIFFESQLKKVKIVTMDSEDYFYGSIQKLQEILPKNFIPSHRSFLVNFYNVEIIEKNRLIMNNNSEVPISQRYLKKLRTLQLSFEKDKRDARI